MATPNLIEEVRQLNKIITRLDRRYTLGYSFVRGVFTGLGTVIGATVVVALIAYLLSHVEFIPLIGSWLSEIMGQVEFPSPN